MTKLTKAQQSFLIQYLSLILIVLSILVAAVRTKKHEPEPARNPDPHELRAALSPDFLMSELTLENIFSADGQSIDAAALDPIKQLLENHNIDLQLYISAREGSVSKVVQLSRILREKGFWKNSFTVSGQNDPAATSPKVIARFEWSKS